MKLGFLRNLTIRNKVIAIALITTSIGLAVALLALMISEMSATCWRLRKPAEKWRTRRGEAGGQAGLRWGVGGVRPPVGI